MLRVPFTVDQGEDCACKAVFHLVGVIFEDFDKIGVYGAACIHRQVSLVGRCGVIPLHCRLIGIADRTRAIDAGRIGDNYFCFIRDDESAGVAGIVPGNRPVGRICRDVHRREVDRQIREAILKRHIVPAIKLELLRVDDDRILSSLRLIVVIRVLIDRGILVAEAGLAAAAAPGDHVVEGALGQNGLIKALNVSNSQIVIETIVLIERGSLFVGEYTIKTIPRLDDGCIRAGIRPLVVYTVAAKDLQVAVQIALIDVKEFFIVDVSDLEARGICPVETDAELEQRHLHAVDLLRCHPAIRLGDVLPGRRCRGGGLAFNVVGIDFGSVGMGLFPFRSLCLFHPLGVVPGAEGDRQRAVAARPCGLQTWGSILAEHDDDLRVVGAGLVDSVGLAVQEALYGDDPVKDVIIPSCVAVHTGQVIRHFKLVITRSRHIDHDAPLDIVLCGGASSLFDMELVSLSRADADAPGRVVSIAGRAVVCKGYIVNKARYIRHGVVCKFICALFRVVRGDGISPGEIRHRGKIGIRHCVSRYRSIGSSPLYGNRCPCLILHFSPGALRNAVGNARIANIQFSLVVDVQRPFHALILFAVFCSINLAFLYAVLAEGRSGDLMAGVAAVSNRFVVIFAGEGYGVAGCFNCSLSFNAFIVYDCGIGDVDRLICQVAQIHSEFVPVDGCRCFVWVRINGNAAAVKRQVLPADDIIDNNVVDLAFSGDSDGVIDLPCCGVILALLVDGGIVVFCDGDCFVDTVFKMNDLGIAVEDAGRI